MKKILTFSFLSLLFLSVYSQNVGVGTIAPDASAKLDISASDKGLLIPRVNLTALNAAAPVTSPATGLMVYNTNAALSSGEGFYYWNGSAWIKFSTGAASTQANNALSVSNDTVQLGGDLLKNTTITQANFNLINDLTGTGNFEIRKAGATDLFISGANGNVGIKNNNPTNLLDIAAAGRSGSHPTGLGLYVTANSNPNSNGVEFRHSNGTQGIGFGYNTIYATGTNTNQDLGISSKGTGVLAFTTNALERMRIDGNGNIGVNTNAPAGRIDVAGTPYNVANVYKDFSQTILGCYWFGTNYFSQCFTPTQNGVVMRVDLSLRTVPAGTYTLTINGQSSALVNPVPFAINSFYFPTPPAVTAGTNTTWILSGTSNFELRGNCGGGCGNGSGGATYWNEIYLAPQGAATANLFVSDINGLVGVNTKTPSANLEVVGLTRAKGNLDITGLLTINNNAGTTGQVLTSAGNTIAPTWSSVSAALGTDTDANDGLTVTYPNINVNVSNGISLANDNVKLGGTLDQATTITQANFDLIHDLTGTGNFEVRKSGATDLFISGTNGKVGIGTNVPQQALSVSSGANIDQAGINDGNLTNALTFGNSSGEGMASKRTVGGNQYGIDFYTNFINRMSITNGGNVGIGTTSPAVKLAIGGSGTNVYGTDVWVENNLHAQGSETLTIGGRGRLRVGTAWSYAGLYAEANPTGANDLVLGASSGQVRVGPGGGTIQNLYLGNGAITSYLNNANACPIVGYNANTNGTGIAAGGNNQGVSYLAAGSGGAFMATQFGVLGYSVSANTTIDRAGGLFGTLNFGAYAYIGVLDASNIARKIVGVGTVNTIVKDLNNNRVLLSAPEAPENLFEDYGTGLLTNGFAHIDIDPIFAKNIIVNQQHDLRVFIQLEGDCNGVFVMNKTGNSFEVKELSGGTSNTRFTYHIIANRADEVLEDGTLSRYSMERFAPAMEPQEMKTVEQK